MTEVTFDFDGVRGYRLSGRLLAPEAVPRAWAIFAHCFTCGKDSLAASRIGEEGFGDFCHRIGIAALRDIVEGCRRKAA